MDPHCFRQKKCEKCPPLFLFMSTLDIAVLERNRFPEDQPIIPIKSLENHPGCSKLLWTDVRSCSGISIQFTTGKSWPFSAVSLRIYI